MSYALCRSLCWYMLVVVGVGSVQHSMTVVWWGWFLSFSMQCRSRAGPFSTYTDPLFNPNHVFNPTSVSSIISHREPVGNTTSKNVSLQIFPQSLFLVRHDDYDYRELETLLPPLLRYFSSKNVTKYQILLRECNQAIEISTSGSSSRCVVAQRQGQESLQQSASLPTSWTTQQRWFSFPIPIFPPIFLANKFNYSTKVIFPNWTTEQR